MGEVGEDENWEGVGAKGEEQGKKWGKREGGNCDQ